MPSDELITLDPAPFATGRTALSLESLGLKVREAKWGDSDLAVFYIRQARGEIPADSRPPNRQAELKLMVKEEGATSLATAAIRLQKKVGLFQQKMSGWVERKPDSRGKFAEPVVFPCYAAVLGGLDGWLMAHRKAAPDVTLNLNLGPYCYGTKQVSSAVFKEEAQRRLIWEIANITGSAPGLIYRRITNLGASNFKSLIACMESQNMAQDATKNTTAKMAYNAQELTPIGASTKAEVGGFKVIQNTKINFGWLTVLDSEISGVGHMTHTGPRQLWARVEGTAGAVGNMELRVRWRALGSLRWTTNVAVPSTVTSGYQWYNLGECRPEPAVIGENRWEFQIQARSPTEGITVKIHEVMPTPTEQALQISVQEEAETANAQEEKNPGTVADDATVGTIAWTTPENAKAADLVYTTCKIESPSQISHYLKATNYGFAIPVGATITGVAVGIARKCGSTGMIKDYSIKLVKGGVISGTDMSTEQGWPAGAEYDWFGGAESLWGLELTRTDTNAANFGVVMSCRGSVLATFTAQVDVIKIIIYYTEAVNENVVCFASRSIELRSDGCFRQAQAVDVWGKVVQDGFLPYAPPSRLENTAVRGLVLGSQGDLDSISDAGSNKIQEQVKYYPGYHFVSESE